MRIAHTGDIHYCPEHLKWVDKAMESFVGAIYDDPEPIDLAVLAGDLFDRAMPLHEPAVTKALARLSDIADVVPMVNLQGTYSHDRPGSLDVINAFKFPMPVLVITEPGAWWLEKIASAEPMHWTTARPSNPAILVLGLPSLNRADPEVQRLGAAEWVRQTLAGFRPLADEARAIGVPSILVAHGTVTGSVTESNFAMISPDHEFDIETLYSAGSDAVMLAHIHKHQSWIDNRQTAAYCGSLARLVHGDHDQKGWLLWDVVPGHAEFQFRPTPTRRLVEIEFPGPPDMAELADYASNLTDGDAVRIRYSIDEEHVATVDKAAIKALFAQAESCKIEAQVLAIQSVRAAGISRALTLEEKMRYYLRTIGNEDRYQDLLAALQRLQSQAPENIARDISKAA